MQQTEKYKLNLIETSDPFSPSPLNENMEKLEAALAAETTAEAEARAAGDAALDARVRTLELRRLAYGTYTGTGGTIYDFQIIELGFKPIAVIVSGTLYVDGYSPKLEMIPEGFKVSLELIGSTFTGPNLRNVLYSYMAIG